MNSKSLGRIFGPIILAIFGYEWFMAGYEKVLTNDFVNGLPKGLTFFASKNQSGWYKDFLTTYAIPNATTFGYVTEWGEVLAGLGLFAAAALFLARRTGILVNIARVIAIVSLAGGLVMNVNYFYAAGWTSVSTFADNQTMALVEVFLIAAIAMAALEPRILAVRAARTTPASAKVALGVKPVAPN